LRFDFVDWKGDIEQKFGSISDILLFSIYRNLASWLENVVCDMEIHQFFSFSVFQWLCFWLFCFILWLIVFQWLCFVLFRKQASANGFYFLFASIHFFLAAWNLQELKVMKRSKIQAFVELAAKHLTKEVSGVSNEIFFKHKLFYLCYYLYIR
jgi:hypothetical protein